MIGFFYFNVFSAFSVVGTVKKKFSTSLASPNATVATVTDGILLLTKGFPVKIDLTNLFHRSKRNS